MNYDYLSTVLIGSLISTSLGLVLPSNDWHLRTLSEGWLLGETWPLFADR